MVNRMATLEDMITISLVTPMGDPGDKEGCIWGLPLLLWGSPGIGKSAKVKEAGNRLGLPVSVVYPSTRAPEDFSGAPFVKGDKIVIECILSAVRDILDHPASILFIDEISCAVPAVQSALLSVVLERRVGDVLLPRGVRILSAANPPAEAAGGWDLEPPMANRFAHVDVAPPSNIEWIEWLTQHGVESIPQLAVSQRLVEDKWGPAWNKAKSEMVGYMRGGGALYSLPPSGNVSRGRAWQSPRTWEMAARAVATCYALGFNMAAVQLVEACVGKGAATGWLEWVQKANLPDPREMCLSGWKPDTTRLDISAAAITAMAGFIVEQKGKAQSDEMTEGAWKVFSQVRDAGMLDLAVPSVRVMVRAGLGIGHPNKKVAAAAVEISKALGMTGLSAIAKTK